MPTKPPRIPPVQHTFDHRRGRRLTNYSPGDAGTVRLTVLDNGCNGIGDILCYAWVLSSIRAAGRPISFNTHRYADILRTFGLGDLTGTLKAPRIGRHPPKDHPGGWVRHWLDAFGHSGVPIVRPTYTPDPADTEWARATWDGRGQGRRVILFPEAAHNCREWPESHGAHLAWTLHNDGCAVVVCCSRDKSAHNPFPYALWGLPFGKWCALASMADLIIGNDSGPAHVGATLGRPTLVLLGPSPRSFFAHAAEVTTLSVDTARVPCVGCNWNHNAGKGYRAACDTQCLALSTLSPFEVATKALTLMGGDAPVVEKFGLVGGLRSTSYGPSYYEEHKAAGLDYLGHGEWQRDYAAWLLKYLTSPPILDLGCACGSVVKGLVSMGGDAVGVDCSEDMIGRGRKEWPNLAPRLFVGDGANLHHWADGHFGVVHCAQVAEHWRPSSVPAIAAEVARVLKPGGLLFLCLDTQELYDRQHRDPAKEDPTHLCIKPVSWWEGTLSEAGLTRDTALESVMGGDPGAFCRRYDWDWMVFRKGTP